MWVRFLGWEDPQSRKRQPSSVFLPGKCLLLSRLFAAPWTAALQAPLSFTISWSLRKLMSVVSVMPPHPVISSSVAPFSSCLQSFPASGSFPISWLFASGGQNVGASASASALPKSIQG